MCLQDEEARNRLGAALADFIMDGEESVQVTADPRSGVIRLYAASNGREKVVAIRRALAKRAAMS